MVKTIPDEILTGIGNATVAQHLALNDGTFDTCPKIMDAVRSFVRVSRSWNVLADGDPTDVDAMTKGQGKGQEGEEQEK